MKKLFIFLISLVLLAGIFVPIFLDKGEVQEQAIPLKVIDSENQQVTLKNPRYANGDLDAIFDADTENNILDFNLKSHSRVDEIKKVGAGNQIVMWYDVNSLYGLSQALGQPEFTDMRTGEIVQRDWRYVYFGNESYESPVYSEIKASNGTIIGYEKTGTETKTREAWLPYDSRDIPKGQMRVGIQVEVQVNDLIDGVWSVGGKKIDRHAQWEASLETNLISWYKLDNNNFSSEVGTVSLTNVGTDNTSGIIVDGRDFIPANSDKMNRTSTFFTGTTDRSFNLWIWTDDTGNFRDIITYGTEATGELFHFRQQNNGRLWFQNQGSSVEANATLNTGGWYMVTFTYDHDTTTVRIYQNATLVAQSSISLNTGTTNGFRFGSYVDQVQELWDGRMDEIGMWNRTLNQTEITTLYNDGKGCTYKLCDEVITNLTITLLSPANNTIFTTNDVTFSANVINSSTDILIANVSLLINGVINQTNTSGISGIYNFNKTLADGNYNWTVIAFGNNSVQYNASNGTLVFTIDLTEINVTLNSPANDFITKDLSNIFNASATGNSYDLDNATLYVWFSNGTLYLNTTNTSISGTGTSEFTINGTLDGFTNYLWNYYVCGTTILQGYCTFATNNFTLVLSPFSENSVSYTNNVLETSRQAFIINVSANPLVSAVTGKLWYNGSSHTATITNPSSGIYISTDSIDIPLQNSGYSLNKSFFWQFDVTLTDGTPTQQNTSENKQVVNRTYFELCNATYPTPLINFTTKSAENPFPTVNATFKAGWDWFVGGGSVVRSSSYEDLTENKGRFDFCTSNYTTSFNMTSIINYDALLYSSNFYYLKNATLSNDTQNISLYLLNDSKATITVIKVREAAQQPIEDALIHIQLFDVGTNTYYTVTMAETNFDGEDVVYLNWFDSLYKFIIIVDGETVRSTQPFKISETPQIFDILDDISFSFEKFQDFQYSLVYNNVTENFVLTYTKPSGEVDEACLRVTRRTAQNDTEIGLVCETSSSGTLFININNQGNGTYIAAFYATGSLSLVDWITTTVGGSFAEDIFDALGVEDATAYAILFSVLVFALFLITPVLGVLGVILGIFGATALGFSPVSYMAYFGILILGGIIIWVLKR